MNYSLLVNTTNSFEDCWLPFFKLFSIYWPDYQGKIYLNTETKNFQYDGLNIIPIKNQLIRATWSQCLKYALNFIKEDVILYLQEDYFLHAPVNIKKIEEYIKLMQKEDIATISLVHFSNGGPFHETEYSDLWKVDLKAEYRISLQASLWKKDTLKKYLRKHENPWQLEVWGTKRAQRIKDTFYCVNRDIINDDHQLLPYKPTGIVKGQWKKDIVMDLFAKHGIEVDFSIRGFYQQKTNNKKNKITPQKIINRIRSLI